MSDKELDLEEVKLREVEAHRVVSDLCHRRMDWIMSIPARPKIDPDLIISASLADVLRLIREVERLRECLMHETTDLRTALVDRLKEENAKLREEVEKLTPKVDLDTKEFNESMQKIRSRKMPKGYRGRKMR